MYALDDECHIDLTIIPAPQRSYDNNCVVETGVFISRNDCKTCIYNKQYCKQFRSSTIQCYGGHSTRSISIGILSEKIL